MASDCQRQTIRFKTKRGKQISFQGRPGGTTKHGGDCKPKAPTAAQRAHRRAFASAARKCKGGGNSKAAVKKRALCVARHMA